MFMDTTSPLGYLVPKLHMEFADGGIAPIDTAFEGTAIPEGYKESPIGKYATIGDLTKGYTEAQKLIGSKGAIVPGENATEEDYNKFYNSTGRPEKAEGYKLEPIENVHEKLKNPELEGNFKKMAHKHGLSQKQASDMYKDYLGGLSTGLTKADEKTTATTHETEKVLRAEWGGEYDNKFNQAKRLIDKYGGADGREAFGELGNNPAVLKTIATIASKFSEDGFIKGNLVTSTEKSDAQKKINDMLLDKEHAYWKQGVGHDEAIQEMKSLQEIVHPDIEPQ